MRATAASHTSAGPSIPRAAWVRVACAQAARSDGGLPAAKGASCCAACTSVPTSASCCAPIPALTKKACAVSVSKAMSKVMSVAAATSVEPSALAQFMVVSNRGEKPSG